MKPTPYEWNTTKKAMMLEDKDIKHMNQANRWIYENFAQALADYRCELAEVAEKHETSNGELYWISEGIAKAIKEYGRGDE